MSSNRTLWNCHVMLAVAWWVLFWKIWYDNFLNYWQYLEIICFFQFGNGLLTLVNNFLSCFLLSGAFFYKVVIMVHKVVELHIWLNKFQYQEFEFFIAFYNKLDLHLIRIRNHFVHVWWFARLNGARWSKIEVSSTWVQSSNKSCRCHKLGGWSS